MDFAYSIDEYNTARNVLYVMYTPRPSTGLQPRAREVYISPTAVPSEDAAGIHQSVIDQAPINEWIKEMNVDAGDHVSFIDSLMGQKEALSTPVKHPDTNLNIETPDPAAPVENNPGVENNYYGNRPLTQDEMDQIIKGKHQSVRDAGLSLIKKHVNEHKKVFVDVAPPAPYDEQKVWIALVHDEVTAKVAAIVLSSDPVDLVFDAVNHLPPSLGG